LFGSLTCDLGTVVDAPNTICYVWDKRAGQVLTQRLLDKLGTHLFTRNNKSSSKYDAMLVLILMVKNEGRILERCLKSVESLVDAFCICDTGSTDATCEIAKTFLETHRGCLTTTEWKHFGHNRTISFQAARDYVRDTLQWDLSKTYGLLLDADMVFQSGTLKTHPLTEIGYSVVQIAGSLEYPNCRLVRMDYPWKCLGVTHEYWDGPTVKLDKSVCYIDDRNDGGCKSDKFTRDARLLEEGLAETPTNERYMFYLAQTYHSLGRWKDSIAMYKKRIAAGGWEEEVWYSHYMIGQCYRELGNIPSFEKWMLRAHERRPSRAEPLYKLAKYFREKGQPFKAYHYIQLGRKIPLSTDSLFVETDVYTHLFDYEATIVSFYLQDIDGLVTSMSYLLRNELPNMTTVYQNLGFYISSLEGTIERHPVLPFQVGHDYHPTSVCFFKHKGVDYHNVRFVNYSINHHDGSYMMKEGKYSDTHKVRTQNVLYSPQSSVIMKDASVSLPRRSSAHILGLEDVRVYTDADDKLCFVATSSEYSEQIRILQGEYGLDGHYRNCRVLESPTNASCEKNWIPVNDTADIIYRWHPLEVGSLQESQSRLHIHTRHATPWFFKHLRGSAVPILVDDELWCLVHFVEYSSPRKYYHCIVKCRKDYIPLAISLPFVFRERTIEYCLGFGMKNGRLQFAFSTMDDNPCLMYTDVSTIRWLSLPHPTTNA
jgi:glycosyltransferase involved in cell wall biosynthesis